MVLDMNIEEKHEHVTRNDGSNKMNGSLPKRYPQTEAQIHTDNMRRKETRVYKRKNLEGREERISALIDRGRNALLNADEMGKIPLSDTDRVKEQSMVYLEQCIQDGVLPDNQSFALALGHTTSSIQYYIRTRPDTDPTKMWLEQIKELFSSLLSQAALNGDANNIFAIFSQKANFGWREDKHVVVENISPLGLPKSDKELKQIADKYAIDAEYTEISDRLLPNNASKSKSE